MGALDKIQRGHDSSGRPVWGTRQSFQFYDRVNERIGGSLVIVQGGWSFADASAGTHSLAMCTDYRTWNLTTDQRIEAVHYGRDLMGTMWYRTLADGLDPHIHNNLIGDSPAAALALAQVVQYKAGLNGLANRARDRDPYRPKTIHNYRYIEDDMFTDKDRKTLEGLATGFKTFRKNELTRDVAEKERDDARFSRVVTTLGGLADRLGEIAQSTKDDATRADLRRAKEEIITFLHDEPDVTGVDNPAPDAEV